MKYLILISLLGLAACDGMMAPTSATEPTDKPVATAQAEPPRVTTEQLEIAVDSIDAELERQGLYVPMTDACAEAFGFWAEEFVTDKREYPTAKRLVDAWADVESEGDPEVSCLLAVD